MARASCVFSFLICAIVSAAPGVTRADGNLAVFEFSADSHWSVPFPNDLFTVPNPEMQTQRRVSLPLPADPGLVSETRDTEFVNVLDGFSTFPRITVPLAGAVPDLETFATANVFLVALAPAEERGRVIAIDQRIVDDSVAGSPRLIFAPDEYLREQGRYAIVVTRGLTGAGEPYAQSAAFAQFVDRYQRRVGPLGKYEELLYEALDVVTGDLAVAPADVSTLSVFTTRTVSDVPLKLLRRLDGGDFPVAPARFDLDGEPGLEHFQVADILSINSFVHRASQRSDGSLEASFPPQTLRVQDSDLEVSVDAGNAIFVQNVRTGTRVIVPPEKIDQQTGAINAVDVSALEPQPDDELAVLVRLRRTAPGYRPFQWAGVGSIAFGAVEVPRYTNEAGVIAPVPTGPAHVPPQTGTDTVVFALFLPMHPSPSAEIPDPPWPVVHLLHGGAETKSSFVSSDVLGTAPILALRGLATVAFSAQEFEGGPRSFLEVVTRDGSRVINGTGRAIDVDGDGLYQATELYVYPQRVSDLAAVMRSLQFGVDLDGDGASEIAQTPEQTYVAGVSFGGATAFIAAAVEPKASVFVANVPSSEGSRARTAGYHPLVAQRGRSFAQINMATRVPSLLNGPSPRWGGEFNEDVPLKRGAVQLGLAPGAEAIQRAFDFNMWRDLENMPLAYAGDVATGSLRGGRATLLVQVARGDGAAVNPIQAMMINAGALQDRTALIGLDQEPLFDEQWQPVMAPELARHVLVALPYRPLIPAFEVAGRVCHFTRVQIAEYLKSGGTTVADPDGAGSEFAGDVFTFPIDPALLEHMIVDPGLPPS